MTRHLSLTQSQKVGKGVGQETGATTQSDQDREGLQLVRLISEEMHHELSSWERQFVDDLMANPGRPFTGKMIFKLRDIRDRYL